MSPRCALDDCPNLAVFKVGSHNCERVDACHVHVIDIVLAIAPANLVRIDVEALLLSGLVTVDSWDWRPQVHHAYDVFRNASRRTMPCRASTK